MCDAYEFLIKFISTLSLLLKKHAHITYSKHIYYFYRLSLRKFPLLNLEKKLCPSVCAC